MKFFMMIILAAILLVFLLTGCAAGKMSQENGTGYKQISQEEAAAMMEKDDGHIVLDVRRQEEYVSGHIPGAVCIPNETITTRMLPQLPDPEQIILVYCRSGNRSKQASGKLAEAGYKNVYEFGGIIDWTGETETGDGTGKEDMSEAAVTENDPGETEKEESEEELRARIGDLAYEVTQHAATEYAFTGKYDEFFEKGLYVDVVSGEALFTSMDKYNSGCGWPAFTKPVSEDAVCESTDTSHGMIRTEVRSSGADSHLGHVFSDGPKEAGGLRYCINSAALRFIPYDEMDEQGYGEYKHLFDD